jgi:hypothetical protein
MKKCLMLGHYRPVLEIFACIILNIIIHFITIFIFFTFISEITFPVSVIPVTAQLFAVVFISAVVSQFINTPEIQNPEARIETSERFIDFGLNINRNSSIERRRILWNCRL